jgi:hypothetical protein
MAISQKPTHLRFALTTGLRFSGYSNEKHHNTKKGTFSIQLRMGTFLNSLDKLDPTS